MTELNKTTEAEANNDLANQDERVVSRRGSLEIAKGWYQAEDIERALKQSEERRLGAWKKIPEDIYSPEFAEWLTNQYQLAMAKGIDLGRSGSEDFAY